MPPHHADRHVRIARQRVIQIVQTVPWSCRQPTQMKSHVGGVKYGRERLYRAASFPSRWGSSIPGRRSCEGILYSVGHDTRLGLRAVSQAQFQSV